MASKKKKSAVTDEILKSAAEKALTQIIEIANNDSADLKMKYDIYKWICEMHFGKPSSSSQRNEGGENPLTLSFTGELDKWSR